MRGGIKVVPRMSGVFLIVAVFYILKNAGNVVFVYVVHDSDSVFPNSIGSIPGLRVEVGKICERVAFGGAERAQVAHATERLHRGEVLRALYVRGAQPQPND